MERGNADVLAGTSARANPITLQNALSFNVTASGLAQQVAATGGNLYSALPASKGELEKAEHRIKQNEDRIQLDEDLIKQLIKQVNALTPVSTLPC